MTVTRFIAIYSMKKGYSRADSCPADRDLSWLRSEELNTTPNYETRQQSHTFCNINFNIILLTTWQRPDCLSLWHLRSIGCVFRSGTQHSILVIRKCDRFLRFHENTTSAKIGGTPVLFSTHSECKDNNTENEPVFVWGHFMVICDVNLNSLL